MTVCPSQRCAHQHGRDECVRKHPGRGPNEFDRCRPLLTLVRYCAVLQLMAAGWRIINTCSFKSVVASSRIAPAGKLLYKISSRPISVDTFNSRDLSSDHVTYGSVFARYLSPESGGYQSFTTPSIGHLSKLALPLRPKRRKRTGPLQRSFSGSTAFSER